MQMKNKFIRILIAFLLMLTSTLPVIADTVETVEYLTEEQAEFVSKALLSINTSTPFTSGENETDPDVDIDGSITYVLESDDGLRFLYSGPICKVTGDNQYYINVKYVSMIDGNLQTTIGTQKDNSDKYVKFKNAVVENGTVTSVNFSIIENDAETAVVTMPISNGTIREVTLNSDNGSTTYRYKLISPKVDVAYSSTNGLTITASEKNASQFINALYDSLNSGEPYLSIGGDYSTTVYGGSGAVLDGNSINIPANLITNLVKGEYVFNFDVPGYSRVSVTKNISAQKAEDRFGTVVESIRLEGVDTPAFGSSTSIEGYKVFDENDADITDRIMMYWAKNSGNNVYKPYLEEKFTEGSYALVFAYFHAANYTFSGKIENSFGEVHIEDQSFIPVEENFIVVNSGVADNFFMSFEITKPELVYNASWDTKTSFYEGWANITEPEFKDSEGNKIPGTINYLVDGSRFTTLAELNNSLNSKAQGEYKVTYEFIPAYNENFNLSEKIDEITITIKSRDYVPDELILGRENGKYYISSTDTDYLNDLLNSNTKLILTQKGTTKDYLNILKEGNDPETLYFEMPEVSENDLTIKIVTEMHADSKVLTVSVEQLTDSKDFITGKLVLENVQNPNPVYTTYGTRLSELTLAQNDDRGQWVFYDENSYAGNVGDNYVNVEFIPNLSKYYLAERGSVLVQVSKADLKIVPDAGQSKVFGEADPKLTFKTQGLVAGDDLSVIKGSLLRDTGENAGEYGYDISNLSADNYNLSLIDNATKFNIVAKTLDSASLNLNAYSFIYDGKTKTVDVTVKDADKVLVENEDFTVAESSVLSAVSVGKYSVAVIGKGNYSFTLTKQWEITKAPMSGITADNVEVTYDGNNHYIVVEGYPVGSTVLYSLDDSKYSENAINLKQAGETKVYFKVVNPDYSEYKSSATVKINKKPLTLVFDAEDKVYDGNTDVAVNATVNGIISEDKVSVDYLAQFEDKNVGTDKDVLISDIKLSGADSKNYSIDSNNKTAKANITPKSLKLSVAPGEGVYGSDITYPSAEFEGILPGDSVKAIYSYYHDGELLKAKPVDAGTYTVNVDVDNSNYVVAENSTQFVIAKAENTATVVFPDFMYDTSTDDLSVSVAGYKEKPEIVYYLIGEEGRINWNNVDLSALLPGDYKLVAVLSETANYKGLEAEHVFKVLMNNTLKNHVKAAPYSGEYDKHSHGVSVSVEDLSGYTLSYSLAEDGYYSENNILKTDVCDTDVFVKISKTGYEDAVVKSNIRITPKTAEIEWSQNEFVYNGEVQKPTADITNLCEGDEVNISVSVSGTSVDAGKYVATAVSIDNDNYVLPENTSLNYAIKPYSAELNWENTQFVYNGKAQKPSASLVKTFGDEVEVTISGEKINAGTYVATASIADSNYTLASNETEFVISPKELTAPMVEMDSYSVVYSGEIIDITENNLSVKDGSILTADDYIITGDYKAITLGEYEFKVVGQNNYQGEVTIKWNIGKALIEGINSEDLEVTYDGNSHMPVIKGLTDEDVVTYSINRPDDISEPNLSLIDAGEYKVYYKVVRNNNENHSPFVSSVNVKINKLVLDTEWFNTKFIFDGNSHRPELRLVNIVGDDDVTVTLSESKINAGTYSCEMLLVDNDNYALPVNNSVEYQILPKEISAVINVQDSYYNSVSEATFELIGVVEGYEPQTNLLYTGKDYSSNEKPVNAGTYTVKVAVNDGNYKLTGENTKSFVVKKIDPSFELPAGLTAVYGDKVKDIKPTLEADENGIWSWKNPEALVGDAGIQNVDIVYTPKDLINYNVVNTTVEVEVDKATPKAEHPVLIAAYGDTYASLVSQLEKGFALHPSITDSDSVGDASDELYEIKLVYTPEDSKNYYTVDVIAKLRVDKAYRNLIELPSFIANEGQKLSEFQFSDSSFEWVDSSLAVSDTNLAKIYGGKNYYDVVVNIPITIKKSVKLGDSEVDVNSTAKVINKSAGDALTVANNGLSNSSEKIVSDIFNESLSQKTLYGSNAADSIKNLLDDAKNNNYGLKVEMNLTKENKNLEEIDNDSQILINNQLQGNTVLACLDLKVELSISTVLTSNNTVVSNEAAIVSELPNPVTVSVDVSDISLPKPSENQEVKYFAIVLHNDDVKRIPARLVDGKLVFEAYQFSYYTLSYEVINRPEIVIPSGPGLTKRPVVNTVSY